MAKPELTCWECKKVFKSEGACTSHAKAKKHQWKTPSTPPPSYLSSASMSTAVPLNHQTVTGGAPSAFVIRNITCCPVCFQLFGTWDALTLVSNLYLLQQYRHLALAYVIIQHYSVFHTAPHATRPALHPCSVCQVFVADKEQHYRASPIHAACTACNDGFEHAEELQWVRFHSESFELMGFSLILLSLQHLAERDTCDVCNAHLLPSVTMEKHYWMSPLHPTCELCGMSFRGQEELQWVLFFVFVH